MQLGNGQRGASPGGCDRSAVLQKSALIAGAPCVCICVSFRKSENDSAQRLRREGREPRKRKSFEALLAAALPESQRGDISVFGGTDGSLGDSGR